LSLYLDASALVKRYVEEDGSDAVVEAMNGEDTWAMCRIGFIETIRAVARGGEPEDVERAKSDWMIGCDVVELDQGLAEHAAQLALASGLRALDALHLAAALSLSVEYLTFATWDVRLHRAALERGLRTLPAELD
jgi:predicted nucleic acid-binding protein